MDYNGTAGHDTFIGTNNPDTAHGNGGNDVILGNAGADLLIGGGGRDRFVFLALSDSRPGGPDEVIDFKPAAGELIDVSAIDADLVFPGDQAFFFSPVFRGIPGEAVRTYFAGPDITTLQLDQDGDAEADFTLIIRGDHTASAGFVL